MGDFDVTMTLQLQMTIKAESSADAMHVLGERVRAFREDVAMHGVTVEMTEASTTRK